MARVELPSESAISLDTADGTRYNGKGGYVEIDNPRHLAEIEATRGMKGGHAVRISNQRFAYQCDEIECACGFNAFPFQRGNPCPRCGRKLE